MQQLGRDGHRKRVKETYLNNSINSMPDHNVLEMLLFYSIPRVDVKPIAYNLINRFGSLENVFNASVDDLMTVNGVGQNTAILINLVSDINKRIVLNQNDGIKKLDTSAKAEQYVKNILCSEKYEKFLVVTLDNDLAVISSHIVGDGTSNHAVVEPIKILECIIRDNASSVIIAHNHPTGELAPSLADINFTIDILNMLRKLNINLIDHIIVNKNSTLCMAQKAAYSHYFDNK